MIRFSRAGFVSRAFSQAPLTWGTWQGHRSVGLTLSKVKKVKVLVDQLCPTFFDLKDCSPPGSSIHEILQARILEWVADPTLFTPVPNVYAWTFRFLTKSLFSEISRMLPIPAYAPSCNQAHLPHPLACPLPARPWDSVELSALPMRSPVESQSAETGKGPVETNGEPSLAAAGPLRQL